MAIEINKLKAALGRDIYRPNLYRVQLIGPSAVSGIVDPTKFEFLCRAATIPADKVGKIDLFARGRKLQVPGDRQFDNWSITVYNDDSWKVRTFFEKWHSAINRFGENTGQAFENIIAQATVEPLARSNSITGITKYTVEMIWPENLGAIDLKADQDSHSEFTVEFAVNGFSMAHVPE